MSKPEIHNAFDQTTQAEGLAYIFEEIKSYKQAILNYETKFASQDDIISRQNDELEAASIERARDKLLLEQKEAVISLKEVALANCSISLAQKNALLEQKDLIIALKDAVIASKETDVVQHRMTIAKVVNVLQAKIMELEAHANDKEIDVKLLRDEISDRDQIIVELKDDISKITDRMGAIDVEGASLDLRRKRLEYVNELAKAYKLHGIKRVPDVAQMLASQWLQNELVADLTHTTGTVAYIAFMYKAWDLDNEALRQIGEAVSDIYYVKNGVRPPKVPRFMAGKIKQVNIYYMEADIQLVHDQIKKYRLDKMMVPLNPLLDPPL